MKLLFAHDHRFKVDENGNLYAGGSFNDDVFLRYLDIFDELIIIGRQEQIESSQADRYNPITLENINFIPMKNPNSTKGLLERKFIRSEIENIVRLCDAVVVRGSVLGYLAADAAKRFNKPYLIEVVGCSFDSLWNYGTLLGKLYAPISFLKARKYIRQSRLVLYVTKNFLQTRYPTDGISLACSDVVLNDVDDAILRNRVAKIRGKGKSENIVIGTIGAVDARYKGQDKVIKALALLKQRGYNKFRYQLVGGGSQVALGDLAKRLDVDPCVEFIGSLTHSEVFNWLDEIDIYIQPSKTEGLPRALIEAMSRALPCLGTRVGGIPELLDDDDLLDSRRISHQIAAKLESFTTSSLEKMAKRNFQFSKRYTRRTLDEVRKNFLLRLEEK